MARSGPTQECLDIVGAQQKKRDEVAPSHAKLPVCAQSPRALAGQPPRSLSRMLPPLVQNTSTTPISEPPATTPDATGKVNSSASLGFHLSTRSATSAPRKNKSP